MTAPGPDHATIASCRPPALTPAPAQWCETLMSAPECGLLCGEGPLTLAFGQVGSGVDPSVRPYTFPFDQRSPKPGILPRRPEAGGGGGSVFLPTVLFFLLVLIFSLQEVGVRSLGLPFSPEKGLGSSRACLQAWL